MDSAKKKELEKKGWKLGSAGELLGLSREEMEYIELKIALGRDLARRRKEKKLTQVQLAEMMNSSQSRIAKMEKGDPSVSIDLLFRSHFALGATRKALAEMII